MPQARTEAEHFAKLGAMDVGMTLRPSGSEIPIIDLNLRQNAFGSITAFEAQVLHRMELFGQPPIATGFSEFRKSREPGT